MKQYPAVRVSFYKVCHLASLNKFFFLVTLILIIWLCAYWTIVRTPTSIARLHAGGREFQDKETETDRAETSKSLNRNIIPQSVSAEKPKSLSYALTASRETSAVTSQRGSYSTTEPSLILNQSFSVRSNETSVPLNAIPNCGDINFQSRDKDLKYFAPALTGQNLCVLLETVDAFTATMQKAGVSYFMCGGTLVGSWRHHGFIPWDDDVDFVVLMKWQQTVHSFLQDLEPKFSFYAGKRIWKLFSERSHTVPGIPWKYPFLDINFFQENATHLWDYDPNNGKEFVYPKAFIYPLTLRPFSGRMLPAPAKCERALRLTYDLEQCQTATFKHSEGSALVTDKQKTVPCKQLYNLLPFVKRTPVKEACNETLIQGDKILSYFIDQKGCYPV